MLTEKENKVKVEGILSEIDLKYGEFTKKDGTHMKSVGGSIKVRVDQTLPNGEAQSLEIPVHMFASEMTNKGTKNPAYDSIERVMNEYVSIASSDMDKADRVRITGAKITMNEYYGQNGNLVSFPRISASFVSKIAKADCHPEATFSVIFAVGSKGYDVDKDGVEIPNRYKIGAALPQWGGKVDVVTFIAASDGVISAVENYWNVGDTVKASGRLNFTSQTITKKAEVDFGEAREESHTISVSELVITGGSQNPLEGDFAYDGNEIQAGLKERQARLAELKTKAANKGTSGSAPKGNSFTDLGF